MNWDALGALAETLAAIGVIATLIYLAAQIKESNKTNTALALQNMASQSQDRLVAVASNPSLAAVFGKSFDELDETQRSQAMFFVRAIYQDLYDQYKQFQLGFLPESYLHVSVKRLVNIDNTWGCLDQVVLGGRQMFESDFSEWFEKVRSQVGT